MRTNSPELPAPDFSNQENNLPENIVRQSYESQAAYLVRAGSECRKRFKKEKGFLFKEARMTDEDLSPELRTMISEIVAQAQLENASVVDQGKNRLAIEDISVSRHDHESRPNSSEAYDSTERKRKFFETESQKDGESYWNTLFFPYDTKESRVLAKKMIDHKTIALFGGGRAKLGEELRDEGIFPDTIVNIDPFVEDVETGADPVVPLDVTDPNLPDLLKQHNLEKVDEVWAVYSVPAYLADPEKIKSLFQNIDAILGDGGYARIWPIQVRFDINHKTERQELALKESLNALNETGLYEILVSETLGGRQGLILHKLPKK